MLHGNMFYGRAEGGYSGMPVVLFLFGEAGNPTPLDEGGMRSCRSTSYLGEEGNPPGGGHALAGRRQTLCVCQVVT
jgi:hypothetical protein